MGSKLSRSGRREKCARHCLMARQKPAQKLEECSTTDQTAQSLNVSPLIFPLYPILSHAIGVSSDTESDVGGGTVLVLT